jgi:hypothetical protein
LQAGKNVILVKVCQNEQTESWAQRWEFQLRVCDSIGAAILAPNRLATGVAPRGERPAGLLSRVIAFSGVGSG